MAGNPLIPAAPGDEDTDPEPLEQEPVENQDAPVENQPAPAAPVEKGLISGREAAQQMAQVWKQNYGWSDAAVHGTLANALDESSLNPHATGPANEKGFFQFNPHADDYGQYQRFVRGAGADPGQLNNETAAFHNPKLQAAFIGEWVNAHMPGFAHSTDPYAATDQFMTGFERPADQTPGRRNHYVANAQQLYNGSEDWAQQPTQVAQADTGAFSDAGQPLTRLTKNAAAAMAQSKMADSPGDNSGVGPFPTLQQAWAARPQRDDMVLSRVGGQYSWQPINPNPDAPVTDPGMTQMRNTALAQAHQTTFDGWATHHLWNLFGPVAMGQGLSSILGLPGDMENLAVAGVKALGLDRATHSPVPDPSPAKNDMHGWVSRGELNKDIANQPGTPLPQLPGSSDIEDALRGGALAMGVPSDWTKNYTDTGWDRASDWAGRFLWAGLLGKITSAAAAGHMLGAGEAANTAVKGIGAGAGLSEANDVIDSWTGDAVNPFWKNLALMGVGGAYNLARIPILSAAEKAGFGAINGAKDASNRIKQMIMAPNAQGPLSEAGARTAVGDVLTQHTQDALDNAESRISALGQPFASEGGLNRDEANAARRDLDLQAHQEAKGALQQVMKDGRATERQFWDQVPGEAERDYSGSQSQFQSLKHSFETNQDGRPSLNPASNFPYWIEDSLSGKDPTTSLQTFDTLERGKQLRTQIGQAIDNEIGKDTPNTQLIGNLRKVDKMLLSDMSVGDGSAELAAARAFTQKYHEFTEAPEFEKAVTGGPNDLAALKNFMVMGPKGASAVQALTDAAGLKYGGDEPLTGAYKDMVRRSYIDQVAPNGLVDTAAHERFMGPQRFGPLLAHPAMQDVQAELNAAGDSGRKLDAAADPNAPRPTSYTKRQNALDNWLDQPADSALNYAYKGRNSYQNTKTIMGQLDRDPTGDAHVAWETLNAQKALNEAGGPGPALADWAAKSNNAGVLKAISDRDPSFLDRFNYFTNPQNSGVLMNQFLKLPGAVLGAKFGNMISEGGIGGSMQMASRGAKIGDTVTGMLQKAAGARITADLIADPTRFTQFQADAGKILGVPTRTTKWMARMLQEGSSPWLKYLPGASGIDAAAAGSPEGPDDLAQWNAAHGGQLGQLSTMPQQPMK